jgi:hypothetical protein
MAISYLRNLLILQDSNIDFGAKMVALREFGCPNVNSNKNIQVVFVGDSDFLYYLDSLREWKLIREATQRGAAHR